MVHWTWETERSMQEDLNAQQQFWDATFARRPEMFGEAPSDPARSALEAFRAERRANILELGGGQGRDTLFFARKGLRVTMLDYAQSAVDAVNAKAAAAGLRGLVSALQHDVREPLPFEDAAFDGCYSHMLYCMAINDEEVARLSREIWRVLKPGGLNIFTVRHTGDPHYGAGTHHGGQMWETGGFIVNFFDRTKVVRVAEGYEILGIDEFEEGGMPRKLFRVTLRKLEDMLKTA